jgi:hypothetical protein
MPYRHRAPYPAEFLWQMIERLRQLHGGSAARRGGVHRGRKAPPGRWRMAGRPRHASPRCCSTATTTCSRSTRSSLWRHPPFEPTIEGDKLVARGATDDKGQSYAHVKGVAATLAERSRLPVNVKFIIEGTPSTATSARTAPSATCTPAPFGGGAAGRASAK